MRIIYIVLNLALSCAELCAYGLSYIDTPNGDIDGDNIMQSGGFDSGHLPSGSLEINPMVRACQCAHAAALAGGVFVATVTAACAERTGAAVSLSVERTPVGMRARRDVASNSVARGRAAADF